MTNRILRTFLLLLTALAVFASPSLAQGRGQGNSHKQKDKDRDEQGDRDRDKGHGRPSFRQHDREIIVDYYHSRQSGLPPGLAKRGGDLPPGLEKHLERNGQLPPGLQKRVVALPPDLERRLPRLPTIYRRGVIGTHVIILDRKTGAIVDIIRDVAILAGR